MMKQNILIVEDEIKIALLLKDYFEKANYKVDHLENGNLVVSHLKKNPTDLIILDIMLPGMEGLEICKEVRKFSDVPIIMVTAKVEEIDRLIGLELGADDYICKPFSPREVVARVKSVLRRVNPQEKEKIIKIGSVFLDETTREVKVNDKLVDLTPSEFNLLKVLMSHPNKVFSRSELLDRVQGYGFEGYDRTIDTHIKNLRKKLSKLQSNEEIIKSVYGVGYRFYLSE